MASVTYDRATRIYPGSERPAVDALDLEIDDGAIRIGDRDVTHLKSKDRDIAMVFQSYALYPHMTVADNMGFALKIAGVAKDEIRSRVADAAKILDLEPFLDRKPKA